MLARSVGKRLRPVLCQIVECEAKGARASLLSLTSRNRVQQQEQQGQEQSLYPYLGIFTTVAGAIAAQAVFESSRPSQSLAEGSTSATSARDVQGQVASVYKRVHQRVGPPKEIILYQYEVCPFCNKVRAFLDYHKVPYRTVEVNPLTKKQIKWSEYQKVPVLLLDGEAVNDSSLIMSRLAVEFEVEEKTSGKSWFSFQHSAEAEARNQEAAEEEEIKWRQWVDKRFVQLLTVNIYRSLRESWQTFDYITEHGNFSWAERQAARVAGSGLMYGISGRLIKKYGIVGDVREALYRAADEWVAAIGEDRTFLGGKKPNLADLAMFGVIRSVTGTDTFMDLMHQTKIGGWYERMLTLIGDSSRIVS